MFGHRNSAHLCGSNLKCNPVWPLAVGSCVFRFLGSNSPCILTKALALLWALCCLYSKNNWAPNPFPRELIATELSPKFFFPKPWKYLEIHKCHSKGCSLGTCYYWEDFFWLKIPFYVWSRRERKNLALCFRLFLPVLLSYFYQEIKKCWFDLVLNWAFTHRNQSYEHGISGALFWAVKPMLRNRNMSNAR